jgi:hypothetical protein
LVEQRIENPRVTGSIPVQATKIRRKRKTPQAAKFAGFFHLDGIHPTLHILCGKVKQQTKKSVRRFFCKD